MSLLFTTDHIHDRFVESRLAEVPANWLLKNISCSETISNIILRVVHPIKSTLYAYHTVQIYIYIHMCIHIYIYACMYINIYIYLYSVYIHTYHHESHHVNSHDIIIFVAKHPFVYRSVTCLVA